MVPGSVPCSDPPKTNHTEWSNPTLAGAPFRGPPRRKHRRS
jgi:hypothetical protein